jgi:hypothetical protein
MKPDVSVTGYKSLQNTSFLAVYYLRLYFHGDKSTDPNTRYSYTAHYAGLICSENTEFSE